MFRRTALAGAAILAAAALALTACSAGGSSAPTASGDPNATVNIRLALEPTNLDIRQTAGVALDQVLIDNVYQGLVSRTPDQKIVASLASAWTVSSDALTYTFTLRDGVTFDDGQALTPDDVVWSLTQHRDESTWANSSTLSHVSSISATGNTITLTLSSPDSQLLWNLTGRAGIILKKGDTVDYKTKANGTGPFTLKSWNQGANITLARNDAYWGDKAKVAEVVFDIIPDNQAAISAAQSGEVDVITGFDATLSSQVEKGGDFSVVKGSATDKFVLAFNSTKAPLNDTRVREAIRLAIDHNAIIAAVGSGKPLYGPIPQPDPGYQDLSSTISHDPAKAKQLLADAGVSNLTLTLTVPSFYGTTIPQLLTSNLADAGITLKVNSVDFTTWLNDVYTNKNYDLSLVDHAEPRDFGNTWANGSYYFTFNNPQVQSLYQQAIAATSDQQVDDLLAQAAKIVADDNAADWLYNWESVVAVGKGITGFPADNVNSRINLATLEKSNG